VNAKRSPGAFCFLLTKLKISVTFQHAMLKIRLKRIGRKHDPSFRVVLLDSHKGPQTGKINEVLGFYDARKDIKELKSDRIKNWISKGAQVSDTVHNLLVDQKIIEGKKINVLPRKSPIKKETADDNQAQIDADKKEAKTSEAGSPKEKVKVETPKESLPDASTDASREVKTEKVPETPEANNEEPTAPVEVETEEKEPLDAAQDDSAESETPTEEAKKES